MKELKAFGLLFAGQTFSVMAWSAGVFDKHVLIGFSIFMLFFLAALALPNCFRGPLDEIRE